MSIYPRDIGALIFLAVAILAAAMGLAMAVWDLAVMVGLV